MDSVTPPMPKKCYFFSAKIWVGTKMVRRSAIARTDIDTEPAEAICSVIAKLSDEFGVEEDDVHIVTFNNVD